MQQMSALMNNPAIVDQVIASNPQLAAMGPRVREAFQDEGFRQMLHVFSMISTTSLTNIPIDPTPKLYNKCYVWRPRLVVLVAVDTQDLDHLSVPNNQHFLLPEPLIQALLTPPTQQQQLLLQQHLLQDLRL
jgi:hypothetical protein